jgi:hypothetical protein
VGGKVIEAIVLEVVPEKILSVLLVANAHAQTQTDMIGRLEHFAEAERMKAELAIENKTKEVVAALEAKDQFLASRDRHLP